MSLNSSYPCRYLGLGLLASSIQSLWLALLFSAANLSVTKSLLQWMLCLPTPKNSELGTRNSKPETRNPEPETRNSRPETRKPSAGRGVAAGKLLSPWRAALQLLWLPGDAQGLLRHAGRVQEPLQLLALSRRSGPPRLDAGSSRPHIYERTRNCLYPGPTHSFSTTIYI